MRTFVVLGLLMAAPAVAGAQQADEGNGATRLLRDVAHDYKNFLSLDTAEVLSLGGFGAGAIHAADSSIAEYVQTHDSTNLVGGNEYGSQYLQIPFAIGWWAIAAAAGSERNADAGRDLLRAQLSVVSWTYAIKLAVDRTRPNGDPHGFPSGHASNSFATATVLQRHYGWKLGLPAFLIAAYTGTSRVLANQHYASDVVFGAAVGIASGRTATLHIRDHRVSIAPLAVPGGGGVLFAASR